MALDLPRAMVEIVGLDGEAGQRNLKQERDQELGRRSYKLTDVEDVPGIPGRMPRTWILQPSLTLTIYPRPEYVSGQPVHAFSS